MYMEHRNIVSHTMLRRHRALRRSLRRLWLRRVPVLLIIVVMIIVIIMIMIIMLVMITLSKSHNNHTNNDNNTGGRFKVGGK